MLALLLALTHPAQAQAVANDTAAAAAPAPASKTCYRGQPLPACRWFVLTELGLVRTFASSRRPFRDYDGTVVPDLPVFDYDDEGVAEVGLMRNLGQRDAIGGVLVLGPDLGAKLRYRRWIDTMGVALDLGAGVVQEEREFSRGTALAGDVALNVRDYGALLVRVTTSRRDQQRAAGAHIGLRLGSKPALVGTGSLIVGVGLLQAVFGDAWR